MLPRYTHPEPPPCGIAESLKDIFRAVGNYLSVRWSLFRAEASHAASPVVGIVVAAVCMVVCAFIGYIAAWAGVVFWAAHRWLDGNPAIPVLVMAGIHLAAAGALLLWLRRRARSLSLFNETRRELEEDQRWLKSQAISHN